MDQPCVWLVKLIDRPLWVELTQIALSGGALLLRLNPSKGFIGCQLQLLHLTLGEIPNLGLERRFGNRAHLEGQGNGVLGWPAGRRGANQRGSGQVCAVKVRGERNYQNRLERSR